MRGTLILLTSLAFLALGWPCSADDITSPIVDLWKLTGTTTKNVATGVMERKLREPVGRPGAKEPDSLASPGRCARTASGHANADPPTSCDEVASLH
jgi:hypothetical protein